MNSDETVEKIRELEKQNASLRRKCTSLEEELGGIIYQLPRLRQMIEYSSDILLLVDEDGTIVDCNRAATETILVPRDGLHGQALAKIWSDTTQIINPLLSRPDNPPRAQIGELLCSDGSRIPVEVQVAIFREADKYYALAAARDIRERQSHELALQSMSDQLALATKRQQLDREMQNENRLEALAQLAGGIAHDFNNIFGVVRGNIELLGEMGPTDDWAEAISDADSGIDHAMRLSEQLLAFANGGSPIRRHVEVNNWIEDAASFALSGSSIALRTHPTEIPVSIEVDQGQMTQVLHNLLHNAQEAMNGEGEIHIRTSLTPTDKQGHYQLKILVQDKGEGIPTEFRDRVFDPFFTTKEKGTGIGLATSFRIVRDHGGTLSLLAKKPGQGECFCIRLPAVATPSLQPTPLDPSSIQDCKILVIDDELRVREMLVTMLRSRGAIVTECSCGEDAVRLHGAAIASGERFDLVIMDQSTREGMNGVQTMQTLIGKEPELRVILCSSHSKDHLRSQFGAVGFCAFLGKPFSLEELCSAINIAMKVEEC